MHLLIVAGCGLPADLAGAWTGEADRSAGEPWPVVASLEQDRLALSGSLDLSQPSRDWTFTLSGDLADDGIGVILLGNTSGDTHLALDLSTGPDTLQGSWTMEVFTGDYDAEDDSAFEYDGSIVLTRIEAR